MDDADAHQKESLNDMDCIMVPSMIEASSGETSSETVTSATRVEEAIRKHMQEQQDEEKQQQQQLEEWQNL